VAECSCAVDQHWPHGCQVGSMGRPLAAMPPPLPARNSAGALRARACLSVWVQRWCSVSSACSFAEGTLQFC